MHLFHRTLALFAVAWFAGPCLAQPKPDLPAGVRIDRDVVYSKVHDADGQPRNMLLDLYRPPADGQAKPVLVWVHGGAWWAGDKNWCPAAWMVGRGYAVVSINYRLSQHAPFPAQIHDCKAAIRFLRAHAGKYELDPARIGVMGASAGGHLVALLGTSADVKELEGDGGHADQSSAVQAVCNWFGPMDLIALDGNSTATRDPDRNPVTQLLGGKAAERRELAALANPITHIDKADPPFLILHGDKDLVVPPDHSELLDAALRKANVPVTLHIEKGAGHGFFTPQIQQMIEQFFDKHLAAKP